MNNTIIFHKFIEKVIEETPYAKKENIKTTVKEILEIIQKNKNISKEKIIDKALENIIHKAEKIRKEYPTPGYTIGIKVGHINIKILGGYMDYTKRPMKSDALFDIASMHKIYTQIIVYNLINEGVISFSDKISDLDQRFVNLGDLSIKEVLNFTTEFKTKSPIKENKTIEKALTCLYQVKILKRGKYNYNDIGMMVIKEMLENVTGKTYNELFNKYIKNKLNLKNTYLVVPKEKINEVTGSANASFGMANDPSAIALGGYSGHAGAFASSDDLIKVGQGIIDGIIFPKEMLKDAYTPGIKKIFGIMGNTYTAHKDGVKASYIDCLEPITDFSIQGSTRCQMIIGKYSISTILLNPASMSIEQAKQEEKKVNKQQLKKGKPKLKLVKSFSFIRNNQLVNYQLIDTRLMMPESKTVKVLITEVAKLSLQLRFLNEIMVDKNQKEIYIEKKIMDN